jgi:hypothetical protein
LRRAASFEVMPQTGWQPVWIDKHLFNSLHRLIALIEPGAGSNFERPLLARSGHWTNAHSS